MKFAAMIQTLIRNPKQRVLAGLLVAALIGATLPAIAQHSHKAHKHASAGPDNAIANYLAARRAYEHAARFLLAIDRR